MKLDSISDTEIAKEYVRRFTIQAGDSIRSAEAAANHFRTFLVDADKQERFLIAFLNGQNALIATETLFRGSLTSSAVYPREVVEKTIQIGAAAVILAHNHPSGSIKPSSHDRKVTQKLQTALESIDVRILDHIIIGHGEYYSFAESDLL